MLNRKSAVNGIVVDKMNNKYEMKIPENTTKIDDLEICKKNNVISFLDESKKTRKCTISTIVFQPGKQYKCFWDKNLIPQNCEPIGCPIRFIPSKAVKTYHSEINKETFTIVENIQNKKIKNNKDSRISIDKRDYYETDGVFCSFNCCMAFLQEPENRTNPIYRYSEMLLLKMYYDIYPDEKITEIIPAPHWRMLSEFGGTKSIEEFRNLFNKIKYIEHGIISGTQLFSSIGRMYEDQIKF
jgi:hypothetical protein